MSRNRSICIVDDDAAAGSGLRRRLAQRGYEAQVYTSADAFLSFGSHEFVDCLLLDVRRSDPNAFRLQSRLTREGDAVPVIFLSADGDVPMAVQAMKAGAIDFLTKPVTDDVLMAAVERALARADERRTERDRRAWARELFERLTPREREVFLHLLAGKRNKQIAGALSSREATIKVHRSRLMRKLESRTLPELMHIGRELELEPELEETGTAAAGVGAARSVLQRPVVAAAARRGALIPAASPAWKRGEVRAHAVAANDGVRERLFAQDAGPTAGADREAPKRRPRIQQTHNQTA